MEVLRKKIVKDSDKMKKWHKKVLSSFVENPQDSSAIARASDAHRPHRHSSYLESRPQRATSRASITNLQRDPLNFMANTAPTNVTNDGTELEGTRLHELVGPPIYEEVARNPVSSGAFHQGWSYPELAEPSSQQNLGDLGRDTLVAELRKKVLDLEMQHSEEIDQLIHEHDREMMELDAESKKKMYNMEDDLTRLQKTIQQLQSQSRQTETQVRDADNQVTRQNDVNSRTKQELQREKIKLEDQMEQMAYQFEAKIAALHKQLGEEREKSNRVHVRVDKERTDMVAHFESKIQELQVIHESEILAIDDSSKLEINKIATILKELKHTHQLELESSEATKEKQLADMDKAHREHLVDIRLQHETEMERHEAEHNAQLTDNNAMLKMIEQNSADMRASLENEIASVVRTWKQRVQTMEAEHAGVINNLKIKNAEQSSEAEARLQEVIKKHNKEKHRLTQKYEAEKYSMILRFDGLKKEQTTKEQAANQVDDQIQTKYTALVGEVDYIARLDWDMAKRSTWPYSDKILQRAENTRRFKQHIIMDLIWSKIKDAVFSTPFQIFEGEQHAILQEWTKLFPPGKCFLAVM